MLCSQECRFHALKNLFDMSAVQYEGYHGTSLESSESICENGFEFDKLNENGDELLLGNGIYFFIGGISDPEKDAFYYAVNIKKEENPAVVKAMISVEKDCILDLTSIQGLAIFNKYKERFFAKKIEKKEKMGRAVDDGKIINTLVGEVLKDTQVVISIRNVNLYSDYKTYNLHSLVQNCIFCCVREPRCISNVEKVNMED